jgi:transcriptional regulator with XRE-family HTH domain
MGDFGTYLKNLRDKSELSLRDVAARSGMSYSYLNLIEHGRRNIPGADILKRLAPVYGVPVQEMLEAAGYLDEIEPAMHTLSEKIEVDMAFQYVMSDPRYRSGARIKGKLTTDIKRFVVEMYEKSTGKKLLSGGKSIDSSK